jgi:hypothetical protein
MSGSRFIQRHDFIDSLPREGKIVVHEFFLNFVFGQVHGSMYERDNSHQILIGYHKQPMMNSIYLLALLCSLMPLNIMTPDTFIFDGHLAPYFFFFGILSFKA